MIRGAFVAVLCLWTTASAMPPADPAGDTDAAPAPVMIGDPLTSPGFRFCHEPRVDGADVARFCALLEAAPEGTCPGMRETCEGRAFDGPSSGCGGAGGQSAPGGFGGLPEAPPPVMPNWSLGCEAAMPGLEAMLRWGLALLAAGLLVALGTWLLARLGLRRRVAAPAPPTAVPAAPEAVDVPTHPAGQLLARARDALTEGDAAGAILFARAAALRHLADAGRIVLHRTRTDRELLRSVRKEADVAPGLKVVLRAVERVRWARSPVTADDAKAAIDAASRLLVVAWLALGLAAAPSAHASSRYGPWGDAGLVHLLDEAGYDLVQGISSFQDLDDGHDVVWLDLYFVEPTAEDWTALEDWVLSGGVLVVGGDPSDGVWVPGTRRLSTGVPGETLRSEYVRVDGEGPPFVLLPAVPRWPGGSTYEWCVPSSSGAWPVLIQEGVPVPGAVDSDAASDTDWAGLDTATADTADSDDGLAASGPPAPAEALAADTGQARPLESDSDSDSDFDSDAGMEAMDEGPYDPCEVRALIVAFPYEHGLVVVVPDAAVFANAALMVPENRAAMAHLPRVGEGLDLVALPPSPRVVMATAGRSMASGGGGADLANPRWLPFLGQLLIAWGLAVWWLGRDRVPPRDPADGGRMDLLAHVDALADHLRASGDEAWAAKRYARWVQETIGAHGVRRAARAQGQSAGQAQAWADRVVAVADGRQDEDLAFVEALCRLLGRREA